MIRSAIVVTSVALAWAAVACGSGSGASQDASVVSTPPTDAGAVDTGLALGQVDRAGRPLLGVMLIPNMLQNDYNAVSTFDASPPRTLQDALTSRMHALDTIAFGFGGPDPVDWPIDDAGAHPLLPVFATDVLLLDTAKPCSLADGGFAASYLEIEREVFPDLFGAGPPHVTCGGRTPTDDVVDTTLALLVTGNRDGGPSISQAVTGATKPATTTFPYLADPN
jgi:hypothetical protein